MTEPDRLDDERLDDDQPEGQAVRAFVKRALARPIDAPDLLPGIQRRIRRRSRGKLFPDGWSANQTRVSYVLVGLLTLLVVILAYFVLWPTAFSSH